MPSLDRRHKNEYMEFQKDYLDYPKDKMRIINRNSYLVLRAEDLDLGIFKPVYSVENQFFNTAFDGKFISIEINDLR